VTGECPCEECSGRRAFAERIRQIKEELKRTSPGFGEFDWEDLERSSHAYSLTLFPKGGGLR